MRNKLAAKFQVKHIVKFLNELLQQDLINSLEDLNKELKEIRTRGRGISPTSLKKDNAQYVKFLPRYKELLDSESQDEDTHAALSELQKSPEYEIYLRELEIIEWKKYKSEEYIQLEELFKQYKELLPLSMMDEKAFEEARVKKQFTYSQDECKNMLDRIRNSPYFDKYYEKKRLSSQKYRLPRHVSEHIRYILQQVTLELLEHAMISANVRENKTCKLEHLVGDGYQNYSTYPFFSISDPFRMLVRREERRNVWFRSQRSHFKQISQCKEVRADIPQESFEAYEIRNGNCRTIDKPRTEKQDQGDRTVKKIYQWSGIHNAAKFDELKSTVVRISNEVKRAKGGVIMNLKVSGELKDFITAVVSSILVKLIYLMKEFTLAKNRKSVTFTEENLAYILRSIIIYGGDDTYGRDDSHYNHLLEVTAK